MTLEEARKQFVFNSVKVLTNKYGASHPSEKRLLKAGDVIKVNEVIYNGELQIRFLVDQSVTSYQTMALDDVVLFNKYESTTLEALKKKFVGKQVKVVANRYNASHPSENRFLKAGDVVKIDHLPSEGIGDFRFMRKDGIVQTMSLDEVVLVEQAPQLSPLEAAKQKFVYKQVVLKSNKFNAWHPMDRRDAVPGDVIFVTHVENNPHHGLLIGFRSESRKANQVVGVDEVELYDRQEPSVVKLAAAVVPPLPVAKSKCFITRLLANFRK